MKPRNAAILLTIDVEDWFQVENFKQCIPFSSWSNCEWRVEENTHRLLDLLDSQRSAVSGQRSVSTDPMTPANRKPPTRNPKPNTSYEPSAVSHELGCDGNPKATFFVLGWIARRLPHLVREINARGHEVASHGYHHGLCNRQSPEVLKRDLVKSKKILEDIIGAPVYGYRAPSFAVNDDTLKTIEASGYLYDSSFNSFSMHSRYGQLELSKNGKNGIGIQVSDSFYELPVSNWKLGNQVIPWGGGGYFRLIPLPLFKLGVRSILNKEKAYLLYIHPWEIDSEQPRVRGASVLFRFRHYLNLGTNYSRLSEFLRCFDQCSFTTCLQYLQTQWALEL